jgi:hypothetical protein
MVDYIAIPLHTKGLTFQIGPQISSIASECLVGVLNPASKDTMAPLHVLSDLQFSNWLAIWPYKIWSTDVMVK